MAAPTNSVLSTSLASVIFCVLLSAAPSTGSGFSGDGTPDFDFERDAFIAHSYKLWVSAGNEECAYQKVRPGTQLNVGFEVLSGGDREISLFVLDRAMEVLDKFEASVESSWEKTFETEDVVAFCFENYQSRFTDKLIFFYVSAYVPHEVEKESQKADEKWKEEMEFDNVTRMTSDVMDRLSDKVMNMTYHQTISRMHMITDFYIGEGNNAWVMHWSITQIVVIMGTAAIQVFFVRRMFGSTMETKTPTGNIRA